jgi:excisionase family DNA binding protein
MTDKKDRLPRPPPGKILLSVREAAAVLDMSENAVRNLIRDGKIRAVVPGKASKPNRHRLQGRCFRRTFPHGPRSSSG